MFISIYKSLIKFIYPIILKKHFEKRKEIGKECVERFNERQGETKKERPKDKLVWLHASSVGESISTLPLINKLLEDDKDLHVMITTGTVTSADIMAKRLPKRAFHQFMPIDHPDFCKKFLAHWKPDIILWLESDFWPSMLSEIKANEIKLILVNGRISDRSFHRWSFFKPIIKQFLDCFTHCMGQTDEDARRLKVLGAKSTSCSGNLKFAGLPLPKDEKELKTLQKEIGRRKIWIAAATHNDEEIRLAKIHQRLSKKHEDLLTIIVPRHAVRGTEIKNQIDELGFNVSLRSENEKIEKDTEMYIADTMGEMGLFYSLCDIVFIGGSLIPHGGQNFIEPSRMNSAIITGPHMHNFTEAVRKSKEVNGIVQCRDEDEIFEKLDEYLSNDTLKEEMIKNAKFYADKENHVLENIVEEVKRYIK